MWREKIRLGIQKLMNETNSKLFIGRFYSCSEVKGLVG